MNTVGMQQEIIRLKTIYSQLGTQAQYTHRIILNYINKVLSDLDSILAKNSQNSEKFIEVLILFLAKNWELTKGSMLCYTALPHHDITQLLCDIAEYVAKNNGTSAINVLMPDVSCESLLPHLYPNLDEVALREVIITHILGSDLYYLTPILLLTKTPIEELNKKLANPYYDFDSHEQSLQYLSNEDLKLLHNHSYETALILDTANQYKILAENKDTLLGQLNKFVSALAYNSAKAIGYEESAGEGGYTAIVNFMKYWDSLDIADIPSPIIEEINLIKNLGSDKTKMGNIASCFSTRREVLLTIINKNREKLASISLNGKAQEKQISIVLNVFNEATAHLERHLNEKKYSGCDQRGITSKIINSLGVNLECNNIIELTALLKGISAREVLLLCDLKDTSKKIVRAISNVENVILLATELSDEVLKSVFLGIKNDITDIIRSIADFRAIFIALNSSQCLIVCEVLKEQLLSITEDIFYFREILRDLTLEKKSVIFENIKENLLSIIKDPYSFKIIFEYLTPEQCSVGCEVVKEKLPTMINSACDLSEVIQYLTPEQCTVICKALKEKLPVFIKSVSDFRIILQYLTPNQRGVIYEFVKEKLPVIINSAYDLNEVIQYLTPEQCTVVCKALKEKLSTLIKSASDFKIILQYLTPNQRGVIYEFVKEKLPVIINSAYDFRELIQYLTPEQCTVVCKALKEKLSVIIEDPFDFKIIVRYLTFDQFVVVCEFLKLPTIINSAYDFKIIIESLSPEQCNLVCEILKERLSDIINSSYDFTTVVEFLNPNECNVVCEILRERLSDIINSSYDFITVIEFLNPKQRSVVCEVVKEKLPQIIEDTRPNRSLSLKKQRYCLIEADEAFEALKALQIKSEQLKKGFTSLFFKNISQEKCASLDAISALTMNILRKRAECSNFLELNKLKQIIENDMPTLKKHRGFIKFHKTTSNQIVIKLLKSLEELVAAHKMANRMGMFRW